MPKVYFKGNMPAVEINSEEADRTREAFENGKPGSVVKIGNVSIKVSEIKGIITEKPVEDNQWKKTSEEVKKDRENFFSLSPAQKVDRVWKNMIVHLLRVVGKDPKTVEEKSREHLLEHFTKYPRRYYPDRPTILAILKGTVPSGPAIRLFESVLMGINEEEK